MRTQFPTLADNFFNYFDVDLVNDHEMAARAARLRYRVYCDEFGYEPSAGNPDRLETDTYDSHALQSLVTHRRTGMSAGCVRLVCPSDINKLPLEFHCLSSVYLDKAELLTNQRDKVCEFSRLAVDSRFRKRAGEYRTRLGPYDGLDCSRQELRTFASLGMASFLSAFALASLTNRTEIFAMMEPKLPVLLRRAGIVVQQSGELIEYHGQRAAHHITLTNAVENMRDDVRVLYDEIYRRLDENSDSTAATA